MHASVCVRACVRACARACVRECVRACEHAHKLMSQHILFHWHIMTSDGEYLHILRFITLLHEGAAAVF